jgi:hypothetical protein
LARDRQACGPCWLESPRADSLKGGVVEKRKTAASGQRYIIRAAIGADFDA